jgi:hypothetical protein
MPWQHCLRAEERTEHVAVDDPLPALESDVDEPALACEPGVVDQDVDRAELAAQARDRGCDTVLIRHVGGKGKRPAAGGVNLGCRRIDLRRSAAEAAHLGAQRGQPDRRGPADPRPGPGHERHPPCEELGFGPAVRHHAGIVAARARRALRCGCNTPASRPGESRPTGGPIVRCAPTTG